MEGVLDVAFNSRETAFLIWAGVFLFVVVITSLGELKSLGRTLVSILRIGLAWMFLGFIPYMAGVLYLLDRIDFWHPGLAFAALFWAVTAGWSLIAVCIKREGARLASAVLGVISGTVFVEVLVNLKTFSLPIELVLFPVLAFFLIAQTVGEKSKRDDLNPLRQGGERGLMVIGAIMFLYALLSIVLAWGQFDKAEALRSLALPLILTVAAAPYVAVIWGLSVRDTRRVERRRVEQAHEIEETFECSSMKEAA